MEATATPASEAVAAVRRFNRFYTRRIGVLDEGHLHTPYSLAEGRILYEVAQGDAMTATELHRRLALDAGYLSRLLAGLRRRGLVRRKRSPDDGRQSLITLTAAGRRAFEVLDLRAHDDVAALLAPLPDDARRRVLDSMRTVETLLGGGSPPAVPYLLRPHRPGDMGFIVYRQTVLYTREHRWNDEYEALISRIVAEFLERYDAARERCWIAEREGETVGSVFLIRHPEREGVAKLRLLYVEPSARGLGIGRRLVSECTAFARLAGYHTITLWTNSVLVSARRLYEAEGYRLVRAEAHHTFGHDLVGQTWELVL